MMKPLIGLVTAATLLAACGQKASEEDRTKGPVVSTSEAPRNVPVDTHPTTGESGPTPGANSFTEAQARSAIESAGYSQVGSLTQNAEGLWQGKATKDGVEAMVSVDYKGAVTAS
jgi:putative membrane protein